MGSVKDKYKADLDFEYPTRTFLEVATDDHTALEWFEPIHGIDSVSDSSGIARFVVTGGPLLTVGREVLISGFTGSNIPYNTYGVITAVVAGDFECATIAWIGTEASGSFRLLVERITKLVVDECYKTIREEHQGFAEDETRPDILTTIQTTDATVTAIGTVAITDETTNIVHVDIIGIQDDGTDRATYERTQSVYRTGAGAATLVGTYTDNHTAESDVSWGSPTATVSGNNLLINVTGKVATTINWVCEVDLESFS